MSDPNEPDDTAPDLDADVQKTPHEGPDLNDLEADNPVEQETIETVDPDNAPA